MVVLFWLVIGMIIGAYVGWNLPQPPWAKDAQERVVGIVQSLTNKNPK
jgi:Na+/H+-dicarboxylate symporter